jgi:arginine-tRNA-protein transferase
MQYKVRYRPLERLTREGWVRMPSDEQDRLIAEATKPRDKLSAGLSKDGHPASFEASEAE